MQAKQQNPLTKFRFQINRIACNIEIYIYKVNQIGWSRSQASERAIHHLDGLATGQQIDNERGWLALEWPYKINTTDTVVAFPNVPHVASRFGSN